MSTLDLSVVLPVYKCAGCLKPLYKRLVSTLKESGRSYEIIFVDDGSPDNAWDVISELSGQDSHVRAYRHDRNYGQHCAIATGLSMCSGNWAVVMDADLQDPPELIKELLGFADNGSEIVLTSRSSRQNSPGRAMASFAVRKLLPLYRNLENGRFYATFSLLSRRVIDWYLDQNDRHLYYLKVLDRYPAELAIVEHEQQARFEGRSSYNFKKLLGLMSRIAGPAFWMQSGRISLNLFVLMSIATVWFVIVNSAAIPLAMALIGAGSGLALLYVGSYMLYRMSVGHDLFEAPARIEKRLEPVEVASL